MCFVFLSLCLCCKAFQYILYLYNLKEIKCPIFVHTLQSSLLFLSHARQSCSRLGKLSGSFLFKAYDKTSGL
ncbi:hypothetical protein RJT34_11373 [Clitoria ternatea]|uniref:Uncharacterized protein n=1 Tax=Clitoria ternatea TaxID=43366 RepID=A0AAN9PKG8_CLITE